MGARYAPDQFEAALPAHLEPCDLVAAGGVAAAVRSKHSGMKDPTRLEPQGLLTSADGRVLNVADGALPPLGPALLQVPTVLVAGTGMNAGKTTSMAALVHGLTPLAVHEAQVEPASRLPCRSWAHEGTGRSTPTPTGGATGSLSRTDRLTGYGASKP